MYPENAKSIILRIYANLASTRQTEKLTGVSRSSVSRWWTARRCSRIPRQKRDRLVESHPVLIDAAVVFFRCNPFASSSEFRSHIRTATGQTVSVELSRLIRKKAGLTRKRARNFVTPMRHEDHLRAFLSLRDRYVRERRLIVSVDETSFGRSALYPRYGYAPRGSRLNVFRSTPPQPKTVSVLAAVCPGRPTQCMQSDRAFNSDAFTVFLRGLRFPRKTVILLDNASIHKTKQVREAAERRGFSLLFTPPYSPVFNPIEGVFSVAKRAFRRGVSPVDSIASVAMESVKNFFGRSISATSQSD